MFEVGWWGLLGNFSTNILKEELVKAKIVRKGGNTEVVNTPFPKRKLIVYLHFTLLSTIYIVFTVPNVKTEWYCSFSDSSVGYSAFC